MLIKLKSTGETVVEVLIAIAVIGATLTGGYAIATRSLNGVRVSQERTEALKIAEEQIELLRYKFGSISSQLNLSSSDINLPSSSDAFCIQPNRTVTQLNFTDNDIKNLTNYQTSPSNLCVKNTLYHVAITVDYAPVTDASNNNRGVELSYTVNVFWERPGGNGQEQLQLYYKAVV